LISVIIPAFNVEVYIKDAIESVLNQNLDAIEIIVVDDCSTDNTWEVINSIADRHNEIIKLHTTEQLGPGGARNLGIQHSSGEYLFFLDGDDMLPNGALYNLYMNLVETGADIVIGNVIKYNGREEFDSNLHKKINWAYSHRATHISKRQDMFFDSTATNKLYRKQFISDNELSFPESTSYEDIIFSLKAHVLAKKVVLIDTVVYKWRVRDAEKNPSITQSRSALRNFTERMQILDQCFAFLEKQPDFEKLRSPWYFKVLTVDFFLYLKDFNHIDRQYQNRLYKKIQSILVKIPSQLLSRIPLKTRLLYLAIKADDREELKLLLELLWSNKEMHLQNVAASDMVYSTSCDWESRVTLPCNHMIWTKPYNSYGCEKVGKAILYFNTPVKVTEEAATRHGSYCRIYEGDKELGWVDARALEITF